MILSYISRKYYHYESTRKKGLRLSYFYELVCIINYTRTPRTLSLKIIIFSNFQIPLRPATFLPPLFNFLFFPFLLLLL